jgi:hypothetical protein
MRLQKNLPKSSPRSLPLNAFKTANEYATWIDRLIMSFVEPERIQWQPLENYMQWNALFVTFTFDKRKIHRRQSVLNDSSGTIGLHDGKNVDRLHKDDLSPEFFNIDRLYKKVCREILGRNYSRHRQSQPLLIAAADVNGTRYWKTAGEIQNLHVHTVWVFKKGQIEKARAKLEEVMTSERENEFDFDDIHIEEVNRFDDHSGSSSRLSGYLTKFQGFNAIDPKVGQDLAIYPQM